MPYTLLFTVDCILTCLLYSNTTCYPILCYPMCSGPYELSNGAGGRALSDRQEPHHGPNTQERAPESAG